MSTKEFIITLGVILLIPALAGLRSYLDTRRYNRNYKTYKKDGSHK